MVRKRLTAWLCIISLAGNLFSGCVLGEDFLARIQFDGDGLVSFSATFDACVTNPPFEGSAFFQCAFLVGLLQFFAFFGIEFDPYDSFSYFFFDPVIVQFPANVTNFTGTFDDGGGNAGNLVVQSGLASVPVDLNTTLNAEPGNQLVIVSLPNPPPPAGNNYQFTLNFNVNPAGPIDIKAIITGLVTVNGQNFYPPLFPCVTDFAALPAATIPQNAALQPVPFPVAGLQGCTAGQLYQYAAIGGIPSIPQWGLILLTLSLLAAATWKLAGQPAVLGAGASGNAVLLSERRKWSSSLLLGQVVSSIGLLWYAVWVGPLATHDGVGGFLAGLLIGFMIACYRHNRDT